MQAPESSRFFGPEYKHLIKFHLLGAVDSGKTSLLKRYLNNQFFTKPVLETDFCVHTLKEDNEVIKLQLWDLPCKTVRDVESYLERTKFRRKNHEVFVIVFDFKDEKSFKTAKTFIKTIDKNVAQPIIKILVGTKHDLEPAKQIGVVQQEAITKFMKEHNIAEYLGDIVKSCVYAC